MTAHYAPRRADGTFAYYHDRDGVERIVLAYSLNEAIATFGTFCRRATEFDIDRLVPKAA